MTKRMMKMIARACVVIVVIAGCSFWTIRDVGARPAIDMFFEARFGLVGITRGETARVSMVNACDGSVRVAFTFWDGEGNVVKKAFVAIEPRHAAFLDLMMEDVLGPSPHLRQPIHATVGVLSEGRRNCSTDNFVPSLEAFDTATGQTSFASPGSTRFIKEVDPAPAPSSR